MSALIFILVIETLGIRIHTNVKIKGLEMFGFELKLGLYVDDLWVVVQPEEEIINEVLVDMENFRKFSGLEINCEKTKAMRFGPCRKTNAKFYTIKQLAWTDDPVKILGIWFHYNYENMVKKNLMEKLNKVENLFQLWSSHKLTVIGKIVIANTLATSLFTYKLSVLPEPTEFFFKKYKNMVLDFIWGGKPHKIRYDQMIQNYEQGGLKLVDLKIKQVALKAKWPVYFGEREVKWFYTGFPVENNLLWECNIESKDVEIWSKKKQISTYKVDIWKSWCEILFEIPEVYEQVEKQMIFGNSLVRRAGKPILNKSLLKTSINHPAKIYKDNGEVKNYEELPSEDKTKLIYCITTQLKPRFQVFGKAF